MAAASKDNDTTVQRTEQQSCLARVTRSSWRYAAFRGCQRHLQVVSLAPTADTMTLALHVLTAAGFGKSYSFAGGLTKPAEGLQHDIQGCT
jgi:hypothetical protein